MGRWYVTSDRRPPEIFVAIWLWELGVIQGFPLSLYPLNQIPGLMLSPSSPWMA